MLIYEIQQNSDTTYWVFDWNPQGLDGRPRALHVAESMQSIDFADVEPTLDRGQTTLAACEFFRVGRVHAVGSRPSSPAPTDTFRLVLPIAPTRWGDTMLPPGELALCPASLPLPDPMGEWLEIES